ncbi:MFS transporter [Cryobacterium sp. SO2]|uniref:MFS transporter n=1 Tax=Cryobacterium sp. SO2 TaxID=1897060 RepID=UPI00223CF6AA|nr:MFS transporter [Cryobacterium sp. SO2]WEO77512.1 MFS transporter [Cryobacterium sp. SO2]
MDAKTTETQQPSRRVFVDLSPLRASPAFARLWIGSVISGTGAQLTVVAVGLQIYEITRSTLAVSLVGGIALVPMIIAGLWGGMLADAFDRRRVLIVSAIIGWVCILGMVILALVEQSQASGHLLLWPIYVITTVTTMSATISQATRAAVIPRLLPPEMVSRASALNGISGGLQLTVGPALAGVLVAVVGFPATFAVDAVLFAAGFLGIFTLPRLGALVATARPGLESVRDGLRYLRSAPTVRLTFVVDIIAMTFGRPIVLFPAIGATVIGGGPVTVGILTAATAAGSFLASLFSGPVQHIHHHGLAVSRAIAAFGGFILVFGLTILATQLGLFGQPGSGTIVVALVIAAAALAGSGAADEVSAIFRSTIMLTAAPDEMRGRLQGVFAVVVGGGPRVGDLYSGILASLVALWFPPLLGGLVIAAWVTILVRMRPTFRSYDSRTPTA